MLMSDDHVRYGPCNSSTSPTAASPRTIQVPISRFQTSPRSPHTLASADRLDSWRLLGNCNGNIEYLYVDLGNESANTTVSPRLARSLPISISSNIQDHVVRVGANYHW
jgi:hypothetical protein